MNPLRLTSRSLGFLLPSLLAIAVGAACSGAVVPGADNPVEPGTSVSTVLPKQQQQELDALEDQIAACSALSTADFLSQHKVPQTAGIAYDPSQAAGLPLIQASAVALDADELAALSGHGFAISERRRFPTFLYGYETIYAADLPLYVSADSILYALHRSYDSILTGIETASLIPELDALLGSMRGGLSGGGAAGLGAGAEADADLYLAVARALLSGQAAAPVAGADPTEIAALVAGAESATGAREVTLFGVKRDVDFSQFKPRGHYTATPELERYFRAMMWLGRIDLRILETQPDGSQRFSRRQLEGAFALGALLDPVAKKRWQRVHDAIAAFVGEPDSMTVPELSSLLADLGVTAPAALASIPDAKIAQAVIDGGYGTQRIASHIMYNGIGAATLPLSSSFLLFGQAYVLDSHVFSNLVYDRVQGGKALRMMPNPLDVSFAALANDQAASLLAGEIGKYSYAPDLCSMRALADAHGGAFWQSSLYTLWLSSLRALSPDADLKDPAAAGFPSIFATEAWGRRVANAQLGSWAELRHDTLLYAKQSYTAGTTCQFPDAYVDPYPKFYAAIGAYAQHGKEIVSGLDLSASPWLSQSIPAYFDRLAAISSKLESMAEHQRTGTPFTKEQMDFINQTVAVQQGCGSPAGAEGWYAELFFDVMKSVEYDPTIADVHTQPTDESGSPVGRVLHVGTGMPRLMVATVETCSGPRAYVGLASSYFERVTENYERIDDKAWAAELKGATPNDVVWMKDLVVR